MDVESRFNHTFLLDKFPLDSHKLSILLEDTSHGLNQIFYVIDYKNSGYGTRLNLPGWLLNNWNDEILSHDYGTSFGDVKVLQVAQFIQLHDLISIFLGHGDII